MDNRHTESLIRRTSSSGRGGGGEGGEEGRFFMIRSVFLSREMENAFEVCLH